MSYCRYSTSDFYVYADVDDPPGYVRVNMKPMPKTEALAYLTERRNRGWKVPRRCLDRLRREIKKAKP